MAGPAVGRELPQTPTWAVAVVCLVMILLSLALEHALHKLGHVIRTSANSGFWRLALACADHRLILCVILIAVVPEAAEEGRGRGAREDQSRCALAASVLHADDSVSVPT